MGDGDGDGGVSSPPEVAGLADELADATRQVEVVPSLSGRHTQLSVAGAYRVQAALVARWTDTGERVVGHKVGLTSTAMQRQLGVEHPDSGVLTDRMVLTDGAVLDPTRCRRRPRG